MPQIPTFETERLILRGIKLEDAPNVQKYFDNYDIIRNLFPTNPWPYPEGEAERKLKESFLPEQGKTRWTWAICEKPKPDYLIGAMFLWREPDPENRGFWLGQPYWGRGYMTEATYPINDFAFDELGLKELYFNNAVGNKASRRIKEKTGAKYLRTEPAQFVDPDLTEHELWLLTKEDWEKHKNT